MYRGGRRSWIIGIVGVAMVLCASPAVADEGKHGGDVHKGMGHDGSYGSELFDGESHGSLGSHGKMGHSPTKRGHGKKHGAMHGDGHHHAFSLHTLAQRLHLTTSQVEALKPVEAEYKKAVIRKKADIRIAEIDLGLLIDSSTPDRDKLKTIADSIGRLQTELMMARIDAFLKVRNELTDEQKEEFSKMIHGHMMGHGHAGMHHGASRGHHGMKKPSGHGESPHGMMEKMHP